MRSSQQNQTLLVRSRTLLKMSAIDPARLDIVAFIARASADLGRVLPAPKDVFNFGGTSPALADERLLLAIQGEKTATTSWPVPDPLYWGVGDLSVILDGKGAPRALMRTTSFVQCRFREVQEEFALAEAEGDYEAYRLGHIEFYRGQDGGYEFGEESMVLCERFEVIYSVEGEGKEDGARDRSVTDGDDRKHEREQWACRPGASMCLAGNHFIPSPILYYHNATNQRLDPRHNPDNQNKAVRRQAYAYLDGTTAPGP